MTLNQFEQSVKNNLPSDLDSLKSRDMCFGAAVSGGADSIALLLSLSHILKQYKIPLKVVSINHNIRSYEESYGDCLFVKDVCNELYQRGFDVTCEIIEIEAGKVSELASERKNGIEEAARILRYSIFENFIYQNNIKYFCIAHNQNDQLETLLMRFLQGSSVDALQGIKNHNQIIRPLINIERSDIEKYLRSQNYSWRTDSTNENTSYLRNNIRKNLISFLNEHFYGWKTAVLNGGKKAEQDSFIINQILDTIPVEKNKDECSIEKNIFESQPDGLKNRILLKMCNSLSLENRIPYVFLQDFISALSCGKVFEKKYSDLIFCCEKNKIFVKKYTNPKTDLSFFAIIEKDGMYTFPFGSVHISQSSGKCNFQFNDYYCSAKIQFPFILRNQEIDDEICCKDGKFKKIIDIYSDWKVSEDARNFIPVIQKLENNQEIIGIFGEFLGYKNWIVI